MTSKTIDADPTEILKYPDARILIFAKAPKPGYAKTRLIPLLGEEGAADLYRYLLKHTVDQVVAANLCPVQLWCAPDSKHDYFQQLTTEYPVSLHEQMGDDLGARMCSAAASALCCAQSVILIGADCPLLNNIHLSQSLDWLGDGNDAVLGPAEDGGYVLFGFKKNEPLLFENIPWGGDQVLKLTQKRLGKLGWRWRALEVLWDLDRPSDVERWKALKSD